MDFALFFQGLSIGALVLFAAAIALSFPQVSPRWPATVDPLWDAYQRFRLRASGVSGASWFAVALLLIPARIAEGEVVLPTLTFVLGTCVFGTALPSIALRWRFGPGSLWWTRDSHPPAQLGSFASARGPGSSG